MGGSATDPGPFGVLTRRGWLRVALTGGVVLTGGGVGLLALRGRAPTVDGLAVLSNHEYRTLRALAETHLPRGGAFPDGGADHDLVRRLDAFVANEPPGAVSDLKRALVLFELGPLVFSGRLTTFSNLSPEERLDEWRRWNESERLLQRQVAFGFRKALGLFFFDHPAVWRPIGYPGPSFWGPAG